MNITDEMSKGSFGNVWKSVNPAEATKKEPSAKRLASSLLPDQFLLITETLFFQETEEQPCPRWFPTVD